VEGAGFRRRLRCSSGGSGLAEAAILREWEQEGRRRGLDKGGARAFGRSMEDESFSGVEFVAAIMGVE